MIERRYSGLRAALSAGVVLAIGSCGEGPGTQEDLAAEAPVLPGRPTSTWQATRAGSAQPVDAQPVDAQPVRARSVDPLATDASGAFLTRCGGAACAASVRLPARADGSAEVVHTGTGVGARFRLQGASSQRGEARGDDVVVYPGAVAGADLFHRVGPSGTEDFVHFAQRPDVEELRYTLWPMGVQALRLVGGVLELLDGRGAPRVRVSRPYLIDAAGRRRDVELDVEGCAVDRDPRAPWSRAGELAPLGASSCEVVVRWASLGATYPVLVDPEWREAGNMIDARTHHTATLLPEVGILLVGGFDPDGEPLAQVEIACPEEICGFPSFAATSPTTIARGAHTATALSDESVLVAGGRNAREGAALASTEVYDVTTGEFAPPVAMTRARSGHSATFLASTGEVLVAGGDELSPSTAEIFDPVLGDFGPLVLMTARRTAHAAEALAEPGLVLLVGGIGAGGFTLQTAEIFDAEAGAFTPVGDTMTAPRAFATATLLEDGRVLVTGGTNGAGVYYSTADIFEPEVGGGGQFQQQPVVMQAPRAFHTATRLLGSPGVPGKVLLTGGFDGTDVLPDSEVFDADAVAFELTSTMIRPRSFHAATRLPSGQVLVSGGGFDLVSVDQPTAQSTEILLRELGEPCAEATECSSGFCPGAPLGVCCNAACEDTCQTCFGGACANVENGTEVKPVCTDDVEILLVCENGEVSAGAIDPCGAFACAGEACATSCASDDECSAVGWCNVDGCDPKKAVGESCSEDRECTLGFCADGVCCNARCSGQCEACDLDGAVGVCQQNEGPPRSGRPACEGAGGPCEGVCGSDPDECDYVPIACSAGSCAEGQLTIGRCHLEGRGVCATTTEACEPFACDASGTACVAECATVADCAPGRACRPDGQCVLVESAECDGDHTVVSPDGTTEDCSPFICRGTACLDRCSSVDDCTAPSVCDEAGACVDPPEDPPPPEGCAVGPQGRTPASDGVLVLAALLLGAGARRRRVGGSR